MLLQMLTKDDIIKFYEDVRLLDLKFPVSSISKKTGFGKSQVSVYLSKSDEPSENFVKKFYEVFDESLKKVSRGKNGQSYTDQRRDRKLESNQLVDGITYIPISALAGYSRRRLDPVFDSSLERLYIPGFPYRGENYRIWEVEGNSMEPTFKEHFFVLTEKIEASSWHQAKDYHVYVIVTLDDVFLKRVFKKNKNEWVLISDNEDLYPQQIFPFNQIKELWVVKRKMDWEMSPPKRFEIKV